MDHSYRPSPSSEEVDEFIRNAQLRNELEPFYDESISQVNVQSWTLKSENEFLASMLEWEKAPLLPIYEWFDPPLELLLPQGLSDVQLETLLDETLERLYHKGIVLDYSDHLTPLELYTLLVNQILPMSAKKIDNPTFSQHWNCCNPEDEDNITPWLMYYATEEERDHWSSIYGEPLPLKLFPLYPRRYSSNAKW